jgi:predicted permease
MRAWLSRLADAIPHSRRDRRIDEEVTLHLELIAEDLCRKGWSPEDARVEARRRFGGVDQMKMRHRDQRGFPAVDALRQDLGFALRLFRRDRTLSLAIVVGLSLGIGATVTVFSILNAMLLRDVPFFRDPDRVMAVDSLDARGRRVGVSFDDFLDWSASPAFSGMAAYSGTSAVFADGDQPAERRNGVFVSAGTFEVLGAVPSLGRGLLPSDDRAGAAPVVVLSHGLWADRLGADPSAIGRAVRVNGDSATIVGVMPPGFTFPLTGDLWLPLAQMPGVTVGTRERRTLTVVARLANGLSLAQARAGLQVLADGLAMEHPASNTGIRPVVVPFVSRYLGSFTTPEPLLLQSAAVVLLLIACANASTLLLTRAASRAREIALRAAVGASRSRIAVQLLVESVVLALMSGVGGVALAAASVRLLASTTGDLGLPAWSRFEIDARVLGFAVVVCLVTGVGFGSAPALHMSRWATPLALKDGGRGLAGAARPGMWMRALLALQVALAVILLAGATNLVIRAGAIYAADQAVEPEGVLTGRVALPVSRPGEGRSSRVAVVLHDRLRAIPGVTSASVASTLPFVGAPMARIEMSDSLAGPDGEASACVVGATADYFETLKLRLVAGRFPGAGEDRAALVNQALADAFAGATPVTGRQLRVIGATGPLPVFTIVGVVPSIRQTPLGDPGPCVYIPLAQEPASAPAVLLRSAVAPGTTAAGVRAALHQIDPDLALYNVHTLDELSHIVRWSSRTISVVLSTFGVIAFALSAAGLYAVTARAVAQRTQEIGVHLALGARHRDIWRLVSGRVIGVVTCGLIVGVAGAVGVTRAMRGILIGPEGGGPLVLAGLTAAVLAVAVAACAVPTRRALAIDPGVALRVE